MVLLVILVLVLWVAPILVARTLGNGMGMKNAWLWGFFLGWLGVLVVLPRARRAWKIRLSGAARDAAVMKERLLGGVADGKQCPACAETVQGAAAVCRYCGHRFETVDAPPELAP